MSDDEDAEQFEELTETIADPSCSWLEVTLDFNRLINDHGEIAALRVVGALVDLIR